ncbi:MAG: hypothetical protein M3Y58_04305 [Chloroflexota bacterium]|nr:hypothetical protein [Chloroflexota bacterium]
MKNRWWQTTTPGWFAVALVQHCGEIPAGAHRPPGGMYPLQRVDATGRSPDPQMGRGADTRPARRRSGRR